MNNIVMEDVIKTIKAILISRKEKVTIRDLIKDYKGLNGSDIPYKSFGFNTLDDFLKDTNKFILKYNKNEIEISAIPTKETSHIVALVRKQKSTKKKSNRSQRIPTASDQNWNKSDFASSFKKYSTTKSRSNRLSRNKTQSNNICNNNNNSIRNRNETINDFNSSSNKPMDVINVGAKVILSNTIENQDVRFKNKQVNMKNIQVTTLVTTSPSNQDIRFKSSNRTVQKIESNDKINDQNINNVTKGDLKLQIDSKNEKINTQSKINSGLHKRLNIQSPVSPTPVNENLSDSSPTSPVLTSNMETTKVQTKINLSKLPIQDRLKIMQKSPPITPSPTSPITVNISVETQENTIPSPPINMTPCEELEYFCSTRKLPKPVYSTTKLSNVSPPYQCKVTVDGRKHSTYPDGYRTEYEAKSAASRIALDHLKKDEMRNLYPVCLESDYTICTRMFNILGDHANGIFVEHFPDIFMKYHNETLPKHWFNILKSSSMFETCETAHSVILFQNKNYANSKPSSQISDSDMKNENKLMLPWNVNYWNLIITNPVSTTEIWARLIGNEFNEKFESLVTDMEIEMLTRKQIADSIEIGNNYLVSLEDTWYRVRIQDIDYDDNTCTCLFIDIGGYDDIEMDMVYMCDEKFFKLPPQAIMLSLFGLEDFDENPYVKHEIDDVLNGKTVIGKILTKREDYEIEIESDNIDARVKVVLFDTSSDADLNLNELILQRICKATPLPQISLNGFSNVIVVHINDYGDLFCQQENNNIYYLEKLIHSITKTKLNESLHLGFYEEKNSNSNRFYLYFDQNDNKWYRVVINEKESIKNDVITLNYIDYGMIRKQKSPKLLRTDSLSAALHTFPAQAIKIRLHGLAITRDTVERIKGLVKLNTPVVVKLVSMGVERIPLVELFVRLESGPLLPVNSSIKGSQLLESMGEKIGNDFKNVYRNPKSTIQSTSSNNSSTNVSDDSIKLNSSQNVDLSYSVSDLSNQLNNIDIKQSSTQISINPIEILDYKLPALESIFELEVILASSPNLFIVQPLSDAKELYNLMQDLQIYCENSMEEISINNIVKGNYYAVKHIEDNSWYRAKVVRIIGTMVHIKYIDYGDVAVVPFDLLKPLPGKFRTLRKQAIVAKLYGIKGINNEWSQSDCFHFKQRTTSKVFSSVVKNIKEDELLGSIIELNLIDVSNEKDEIINDTLVAEGRAVKLKNTLN